MNAALPTVKRVRTALGRLDHSWVKKTAAEALEGERLDHLAAGLADLVTTTPGELVDSAELDVLRAELAAALQETARHSGAASALLAERDQLADTLHAVRQELAETRADRDAAGARVRETVDRVAVLEAALAKAVHG